MLGERLCGQQRTTGVLRRGGFGECAWREASWTQRMMFLVVFVICLVVVVIVVVETNEERMHRSRRRRNERGEDASEASSEAIKC